RSATFPLSLRSSVINLRAHLYNLLQTATTLQLLIPHRHDSATVPTSTSPLCGLPISKPPASRREPPTSTKLVVNYGGNRGLFRDVGTTCALEHETRTTDALAYKPVYIQGRKMLATAHSTN